MKIQLSILRTLFFLVITYCSLQAQISGSLNDPIFKTSVKSEFSLADSIQEIKQDQLMKRLYDLESDQDVQEEEQSIMSDNASSTYANATTQNLSYNTKSNKSNRFAAGAIIGGVLGTIIGAKIGLSSGKGDGLAGIITGPLKMGLGMSLGSIVGVGIGGKIGMSLGTKVKVPVKSDRGSKKQQELKVMELKLLNQN